MYQHSSKVWRLQASTAEKVVLLFLLDKANSDGVCWPSIATIAEAASLSPRWVIKVLKALRERGFVDWTSNGQGSNRYRINLAALDQGGVNSVQGGCELSSPPYELSSQGGVNSVHPPMNSVQGGCELSSGGGVNSVHTNLTIEPPIEPNKETTTSPPPISPPKTSRPAEEEEEVEKSKSKTQTQNQTPNREGQVLAHEKISRGPEPGTAPVMTPEQARLELEARKRAWSAPPEPPREMVEALKRADLWERLAALRRYARDNRAWFEWLARALGRLWAQNSSGFVDAVREGLDALARRPDVQSPLLYLERVAAKALDGKSGPGEPSDLPEDAAAFRRYGVPLASGEMAAFVSLSANGRDVIVRHRGELKLVDRETAYARLVRQGLVPKPEGWDEEQELDPFLDGLVNQLVRDVWGEA